LESIIDVLRACHIWISRETDEDQTGHSGYGGVEVYDVYKGTLKWKIEDDKDVITPSTFQVIRPKSDARLISPQHWAQQAHGRTRS
jgi:hypothetical protein